MPWGAVGVSAPHPSTRSDAFTATTRATKTRAATVPLAGALQRTTTRWGSYSYNKLLELLAGNGAGGTTGLFVKARGAQFAAMGRLAQRPDVELLRLGESAPSSRSASRAGEAQAKDWPHPTPLPLSTEHRAIKGAAVAPTDEHNITQGHAVTKFSGQDLYNILKRHATKPNVQQRIDAAHRVHIHARLAVSITLDEIRSHAYFAQTSHTPPQTSAGMGLNLAHLREPFSEISAPTPKLPRSRHRSLCPPLSARNLLQWQSVGAEGNTEWTPTEPIAAKPGHPLLISLNS